MALRPVGMKHSMRLGTILTVLNDRLPPSTAQAPLFNLLKVKIA